MTSPATAGADHARPAAAGSQSHGRALATLMAVATAAVVASACGAGSAVPKAAAAPSTRSSGPATPSAKPPSEGEWRAFRAWLAQRAAAGMFSGAVLAAKDGKPLLEGGYGWADREARIRNTPATRFCIASIGKLFTAVAVAQLVGAHRLSFGDTIGKYLTGFPPAVANHVTIAELLTMTSGLGDVALGTPDPPTTLGGMMKIISAEPLHSRPGTRFLYSNDGYIVLGTIIQAVTGQSYHDYLRQHIFAPAGMTHTDVAVYTPAHVPDMAHGYTLASHNGPPPSAGAPGPGQNPAPGRAVRDDSGMPQAGNPSGGAYSTVGDLLAFARALLDHTLLSPAMTAAVLAPRVNAPQPGGPPVDMYTYGFAYQAIHGVTFVGHNGGTQGYEGQLDIYPTTGYAVIILTNQDRVLLPAIQRSEAMITGTQRKAP